jgi:phage head maturation protease
MLEGRMGWLGNRTPRQFVEERAGHPSVVERAMLAMDAEDARQAVRDREERDRRVQLAEETASAWAQACFDEGLDHNDLSVMRTQLAEMTARREEAQSEAAKWGRVEAALSGRLENMAARVREQVSRSAAFRPGEADPGVTNPLVAQLNRAAAESHRALAARTRQALAPPPFAGPVAEGEIGRVCPVQDMDVISRAKGGDGRTVRAYCAVFNERAEIRDQFGHYYEEIDPAAFSERLAEVIRGGLAAEVKYRFNHGANWPAGTPSGRWQLTAGTPVDIRADSRGLLTVTRVTDDDLLQQIIEGGLTGQSFIGEVRRSSPALDRGARYGADGSVPLVRRLAVGLREYGPVLFPAYKGAEIVGVS